MRVVPIEIPTPFPVGPVNAYLLVADPLTLVDAGPKGPEALDAIARALAGVRRRVEDLRRIVVTHGHADHFGSAAALARRSGAAIHLHPDDLPKVRGARWDEAVLRRALREAGLPEGFADQFLTVMAGYARTYDPIEEIVPLADGERLGFDDGALEVIHTPGHSAGHVALWDGRGALIAGDALLEELTPNPIVEFTPAGSRAPTLPAYVRTLRRLQTLDAAVAYPGHGPLLTDPGARIRAMLIHHDERKEALAQRLRAGPKTALDLVQEIYGELDPINVVLALSEVLGHLDLLADDSRVRTGRRGGAVTYALA